MRGLDSRKIYAQKELKNCEYEDNGAVTKPDVSESMLELLTVFQNKMGTLKNINTPVY